MDGPRQARTVTPWANAKINTSKTDTDQGPGDRLQDDFTKLNSQNTDAKVYSLSCNMTV
jgi:hypothetical protein